MRVSIVLSTALLTLSSNLFAHSFYIGANAENRQLRFAPGYGKDMFTSNAPQANLYGGYQFNPYFAIEAGHQVMPSTTRTVILEENEMFLGSPVSGLDFIITENRFKMSSTHANLVATLPVNSHLSLIAFAGFSTVKIKAQSKTFGDSNIIYPPEDILLKNFSKRKTLPQVGAGVSLELRNNLQFRLTGTYQKTSRFKRITAKEGNKFLTMKSTLSSSLGLTYCFK